MLLLLPLLSILAAADDQRLAHHARLGSFLTPLVTKTAYHTTVRQVSAKERRLSSVATDYATSTSALSHDLRQWVPPVVKNDKHVTARASEHADLLETPVRRSDNLYALHVPLHEQEGYMALFVSNTTTVMFCKGVSNTLYEDSDKVFVELQVALSNNSTTKLPIREDKAIGFCHDFKEHEGHDDSSSPTKAPSSRTSKTTKTADSKSTGDTDGATATAKPSKVNKSVLLESTEAVLTGDESTSSGIADGATDVDGTNITDPAETLKPTKKAHTPPITPLKSTKMPKPSDTDDLTVSDILPSSISADPPTTNRASASKPTVTPAPDSLQGGSERDKSPSDLESLSANHDTVSSHILKDGNARTDVLVTNPPGEASAKALDKPLSATTTAANTRTRSVTYITPSPTFTPIQENDLGTADTIGDVAEATEVHAQGVVRPRSVDVLDDYWVITNPTGAALTGRALENDAAPKALPKVWGILTYMIGKRYRSSGAGATENDAEVTDEVDGDSTSSTRRRTRVPVKVRPTSSTPETSGILTTPRPPEVATPYAENDRSKSEDDIPGDSTTTSVPRPGKSTKPRYTRTTSEESSSSSNDSASSSTKDDALEATITAPPTITKSPEPEHHPSPYAAASPTSLADSTVDPETVSYSFPASSAAAEPKHPHPSAPSPSPAPTNNTNDVLSWDPSCTPTSTPKQSLGCWRPAPQSQNNASKTDTKPLPDESSSAFAKIRDPRLLAGVILMWLLAVLQVVFGIWEFIGFAWGVGHLPTIGRVSWYDEKIMRAEEESDRMGVEGKIAAHEKALERVKEDMRKKGRAWED
jgi:hypothetical protein